MLHCIMRKCKLISEIKYLLLIHLNHLSIIADFLLNCLSFNSQKLRYLIYFLKKRHYSYYLLYWQCQCIIVSEWSLMWVNFTWQWSIVISNIFLQLKWNKLENCVFYTSWRTRSSRHKTNDILFCYFLSLSSGTLQHYNCCCI